MVLSDNKYSVEKNQDKLHFKFSRVFGDNDISFYINIDGEILNINTNFNFEVSYNTNILSEVFKSRTLNSNNGILKLLTINDKINLIPDKWLNDENLKYLIQNNYSNYL